MNFGRVELRGRGEEWESPAASDAHSQAEIYSVSLTSLSTISDLRRITASFAHVVLILASLRCAHQGQRNGGFRVSRPS